MTSHPTSGSLARFMAGDLPAAENRDIVRHLVAGCGRCTAQTTRLWDSEITGRSAPVAEPEAYERAFERASSRATRAHEQWLREEGEAPAQCRELLRLTPHQQFMLVRNNARYRTLPLCDAVLTEVDRAVFDDAGVAVNLADLAREIAEHLDVSVYGASSVADARARALTSSARALRESSDYSGAERALRAARSYLDEGSGDPVEKARYLSSLGSLLTARRRIEEALEVYRDLEKVYAKLGDRHMVGRVQLKKAFAHNKLRDPAKVISLLGRALELLDPARDPRRQTIALHNLVLALIDAGRPHEAARYVDRLRAMHREQGGQLNLVRFQWLEGRLAYALGESATAERCFAAVRDSFIELEIGIDVALASLDLAQVLFERGDLTGAERRLEEAIPILKALGVHAEAKAALAFLEQALRAEAASAEIIRKTAAFVRRVQADPTIRFRPSEITAPG